MSIYFTSPQFDKPNHHLAVTIHTACDFLLVDANPTNYWFLKTNSGFAHKRSVPPEGDGENH
jgi:hypothetical protein